MDIFKLPVHPLADSFPMLSKWELKELADDIKANGLNHPLIVGDINGKRMLVDGRNRREACRMAKVTPEVKELNGADAVNLIISENLMRRNLTMSQRAMLLAKSNPDGKQGKRNDLTSSGDRGKLPGYTFMRQARAVLRNAPHLVDFVIDGSLSVEAAYKESQSLKAGLDSDTVKYNELKENAPDLAELVDGGAKLSEQWSAYQERLNAERSNRKNMLQVTNKSLLWFSGLTTKQSRKVFIDCLSFTDEVKEIIGDKSVISELRSASKVLNKLIEEMENG